MQNLIYVEYDINNKRSKVIELTFDETKNFSDTKDYYVNRAERYTKRTGLVSEVYHYIDKTLFNTICFEKS